MAIAYVLHQKCDEREIKSILGIVNSIKNVNIYN